MADTRIPESEIQLLVASAQTGDSEAFGAIYDALVDPIYRYIFYRIGSREDAEDITEQVFLRAWERISSYRPTGGHPFSAWLYRIAHNQVVDMYRQRARSQTSELPEDLAEESADASPIIATERALSQSQLSRVIRQLPEQYQQVIVLRFVNDLSYTEISAVLDKPEGTVRVLQFRALKRLRELLEGGKA